MTMPTARSDSVGATVSVSEHELELLRQRLLRCDSRLRSLPDRTIVSQFVPVDSTVPRAVSPPSPVRSTTPFYHEPARSEQPTSQPPTLAFLDRRAQYEAELASWIARRPIDPITGKPYPVDWRKRVRKPTPSELIIIKAYEESGPIDPRTGKQVSYRISEYRGRSQRYGSRGSIAQPKLPQSGIFATPSTSPGIQALELPSTRDACTSP